MSLKPCAAATDYTTTGTTIMFGGDSLTYSPKCLKVAVGATVTFKGAGAMTFADHPLEPSTSRGTLTGSPIKETMTADNSKSFTFGAKGFFGYFCLYHGLDSDTAADNYMAGVVWVE